MDREYVFRYENYPLIKIRFHYRNKKTPIIEALLDSGGDFIVIPLPIAKFLGAKLRETKDVSTAGGIAPVSKTRLDLGIMRDDKEDILYRRLEVFVMDNDDLPVLIGRKPFFEDFEITFKKHKKKLVLKRIRKE